jgi:flagellar biosynthesis/type III secretory pathway M-ring protein FliF/YscJ
MKKTLLVLLLVFFVGFLLFTVIPLIPDFSKDQKTVLMKTNNYTTINAIHVVECLEKRKISFEISKESIEPQEILVDNKDYKEAKKCLR